MHRVSGLDLPPVLPKKVLARIREAVENGVVFIAERGGKAVGILGLMWYEPWWSDKRALSDAFFYVQAGERQGGVAVKLLKKAQAFAVEKNSTLLVALYTGVDILRKELFLAKMGGRRVGAAYLFEGGP